MSDTAIGDLYTRLERAVDYLRSSGFDGVPDAALIFGSGLGAMAARMEVEAEAAYADIPGFANTTLSFHKGRLLWGHIAGRRVVAMDGRLHRYEGWSMAQIAFPVQTMRMLGAGRLFLSNIAGGLNPNLRAGDIGLIVDHINLMGDNPLIGPNDERIGPRYPDMIEPYSISLISLTEQIGMEMGLRLPRCVYAAVTGPMFETRAEYRMLRTLGADLVGMSSVPEVIAAVHGGIEVLALSLVSDECFPECLTPLEVPVLLKRAEEGAEKIGELFRRLVSRI
ncbi:MAG: purine-nucleoside phosphorylase [Calditrichaeota bacterium]|nr:purine-nucleoside phosphorylase [Calditrichota bacterium]